MIHFMHNREIGYLSLYENVPRPFVNITGYELAKLISCSTDYTSIAAGNAGELLNNQQSDSWLYHRTNAYEIPEPKVETLISYSDINIENSEKIKIVIKRDSWIDKYIIPVKTTNTINQDVINYMLKYDDTVIENGIEVSEAYGECDAPNISNYILIETNERFVPIRAGVIDLEGMEKNDISVKITLYSLNYLIAKIKNFTKWKIYQDQPLGGCLEFINFGCDLPDIVINNSFMGLAALGNMFGNTDDMSIPDNQRGIYIMQPKNKMIELCNTIHHEFKVPLKFNNMNEIDLDYLLVNDFRDISSYVISDKITTKYSQDHPFQADYLESYALGGISSCIVNLYYRKNGYGNTSDYDTHAYAVTCIKIKALTSEVIYSEFVLSFSYGNEYSYEQSHERAKNRIKEVYGSENFQLLNNGVVEVNQSMIDGDHGENLYVTRINKSGRNLYLSQKGKFYGRKIVFDDDESIKIEDMLNVILKRSRVTLRSDGLFGITLKSKDVGVETLKPIEFTDIVIRNSVRLVPEKINVSVFEKLNITTDESNAINNLLSKETNKELEKFDEEAEAVIKGSNTVVTGDTLVVNNQKYLVVEMAMENGLKKCKVWHKLS